LVHRGMSGGTPSRYLHSPHSNHGIKLFAGI